MRKLASLFVVVAAITCTDREPVSPTPRGPVAQISDGVHSGGNAHFYFLPPLVPAPTTSGVFDPSLSPVVQICAFGTDGCLTPLVAEFTTSSGPGSETVRVNPTDENYVVNWHTDRFALDPATTYRIQVLVAGTLLGFADVVASAKDAKNVQTGQFIPLVNGRTLPIRFRIEHGAVFVIGAAGGSITAEGGAVTIDVPPGALPGDVGITVSTVAQIPADARIVPGSAFRFGPEGTRFAVPVHLTIGYDAASVPPGVSEATLRLLKVVRNGFVLVSGSSNDPLSHTVSGDISSFSDYLAGPTSSAFILRSISVGGIHSCGVSQADVAYCWGDNASGQLGDGTTTPSTTPIMVSGGLAFASISAGGLSTCGLTTAMEAYCWGDNELGQIGDGTIQNRLTPTLPGGSLSLTSLIAGGATVCGLTAPGAAYCWGPSFFGSVGAPVTESCFFNNSQVPCTTSPLAVTGGVQFATIAPSSFHTCGLTSGGEAYCWGYNQYGQLGAATSETCGAFGAPCSTTPIAVDGGVAFTAIALGDHYTCGVATDTRAYCWGLNFAGRLGDGTTTNRSSPTPVSGGLTFVAVTAGVHHTCGLTDTQDAYCWGTNSVGQLGNGLTTNSLVPVPVGGGLKFVAISALGEHTCALTAAGEAYCWGMNQYGELGAPTTEQCAFGIACSTSPIRVSDPQ